MADYFLHTSDVTFDFTQGNEMIVHDQHAEPWRVTVVDTGLNTMTGGPHQAGAEIYRQRNLYDDLW